MAWRNDSLEENAIRIMLITVFTPTYNRANLLPRLYESLCKQTFKDFEWLIVDDGSVDDTKDVIEKLKIENGKLKINKQFPLLYLYQENGGKHRAINRGLKEARGELFFIADSDDWLPEDALEVVARQYEGIKYDKAFAGVAGFDAYPNGTRIGHGNISFDVLDCSEVDFRCKYRIIGDMKEVLRTDVLKEYPFPEIEGEKFCPEELQLVRISKKYIIRYFNKVFYCADYLPDGLSSKLRKLRMDNPISAVMNYAENNEFSVPLKQKLRNSINYWRFRYCINRCFKQGQSKLPILTWYWNILLPIGYAFHLYDLILIRRGVE